MEPPIAQQSLSILLCPAVFSQTKVSHKPSTERVELPVALIQPVSRRTEISDDVHRGVPTASSGNQPGHHGLIVRSVKRGLGDQKQLYLAPFKSSSLKWDIPFLAGSAALFAADGRIERAVPKSHLDLYHNMAAVSLVSTGVTWVRSGHTASEPRTSMRKRPAN